MGTAWLSDVVIGREQDVAPLQEAGKGCAEEGGSHTPCGLVSCTPALAGCLTIGGSPRELLELRTSQFVKAQLGQTSWLAGPGLLNTAFVKMGNI